LVVGVADTAGAQFLMTQDSTLRGVRRVYLNFSDVGGALGPELAAKIAEDAALELRKTGIKVAKAREELDMSQDAVLNVSTIADRDTWRSDLGLRIDVEQRAQVTRTQQTLQMVTWYYETVLKSAEPKKVAGPLVAEGINKWLFGEMSG
ncbi:MAG: hypothetical protein ACRD2A_26010, partial [Vicinamibacterales bacterium]